MASVNITLRLDEDLLKRIDSVADNRNGFIRDAIRAHLRIDVDDDLTDAEKKSVIKGAKNISTFMQNAILEEAMKRKNFLSGMNDDDFAKLVAGRLPKESQDDTGIEADVLSLRSCLEKLPSMEDVTKELSRVKGLLFKAEHERDLNKKICALSDKKCAVKEVIGMMYSFAVSYARELIARKALPGYGDGGGLSDAQLDSVAKSIEDDLKRAEIYGVRK